jgi:hypothetical protein
MPLLEYIRLAWNLWWPAYATVAVFLAFILTCSAFSRPDDTTVYQPYVITPAYLPRAVAPADHARIKASLHEYMHAGTIG